MEMEVGADIGLRERAAVGEEETRIDGFAAYPAVFICLGLRVSRGAGLLVPKPGRSSVNQHGTLVL